MTSISGYKRFLIGGIGGLTPVFALLIAVDFAKNIVDTNTTAQAIGYLVRAAALFAMGGFVAWLHETEDKPFKLFEIGLGAPALIAGLITTNSLASGSRQQASILEPVQIIAYRLVPSAYAQPASEPVPAPPPIKNFAPAPQTTTQGFLEGLLGVRPNNVYYVIAGSHKALDDAKRQAERINAKYRGEFSAEVYAPYAENPYYAVVIGANMTKSEAKSLQARAVKGGLPGDTYLWTFPTQ